MISLPKRNLYLISFLICYFHFLLGYTQTGIPFIHNYSPKTYKAEAQNWSIVQDKRGVMYFGNTSGLLEYDGINWRLIKLPNNLGVRSLSIDPQGRIWVGSLDELGYISPDSIGQMRYVSILNQIKPSYRQFADVWKIYCIGSKVIFQTFPSLFILENDSIKVIKSKTQYKLSFSVYNQIYVNEEKSGVKQLKGDSLVLIPGGEKLKNIGTMLPFGNDEYGNTQILIPSNWDMGVKMFNQKSLSPYNCNAYKYLSDNMIYNNTIISERSFAIATIRGGIVIIDRSCNILQILNKSVGLQDDMVISAFTDNQSSLWMGLSQGISRAEVLSPITFFGETFGLNGTIESIARYKNEIYVATNQGVLVLQNNNKTLNQDSIALSGVPNSLLYRFEPVKKMDSQAWSLLTVGDVLFAATNRAVYKLENDNVDIIYDDKTYYLYHSRVDSFRIYLGLHNGLAALYNDHGKWVNEGKVESVSEQVRSICESQDGSVWLGTLYQGVVQVKFPKNLTYTSRMNDEKKLQVEISTESINHYDTTSGLPGGELGVFISGDRIGFATNKGLFRIKEGIDQKKAIFYKDTVTGVNKEFNFPPITRMVSDRKKNIWLRMNNQIGFALRREDGTYRLLTKPFLRIPEGSIWAFYPDEDGVTWIGGDMGLLRYDPNVGKNYAKKFHSLIRKVTVGRDSVIFYGSFKDNQNIASLQQSKEMIYKLKSDYNSLIFEFAAPSFDNEQANEFKYFLDGFDKEWSDWSSETKKEYTNLPENNYFFRVKSRNVFKHESEEGVYAFIISPPFHKTWWFFGGQLVFIGLLLGSSFYFSRSGTSDKVTKVLTTISIIIIFEYVQNFVEDNFSGFLGGIAFFKIVLNVLLGLLLLPVETLMKKLLGKKQKSEE